jgi:hypothetical protein
LLCFCFFFHLLGFWLCLFCFFFSPNWFYFIF